MKMVGKVARKIKRHFGIINIIIACLMFVVAIFSFQTSQHMESISIMVYEKEYNTPFLFTLDNTFILEPNINKDNHTLYYTIDWDISNPNKQPKIVKFKVRFSESNETSCYPKPCIRYLTFPVNTDGFQYNYNNFATQLFYSPSLIIPGGEVSKFELELRLHIPVNLSDYYLKHHDFYEQHFNFCIYLSYFIEKEIKRQECFDGFYSSRLNRLRISPVKNVVLEKGTTVS